MNKFACASLLLVAAAAIPLPAAAEGAPAPSGQAIYTQRCQACHGPLAGAGTPMAPKLGGVVGRKAAAAAFAYSPALKNSKLVWSKAELNAFLASPAKKVPGTRMVVSIPDAAQRAALINYLATGR